MMLFLVYSLCGLAVFKLFLDVAGGEQYAPYSVVIETVIFLIVLFMIIRTCLKQREGRREMLQRKINELNQTLNEPR
jgi:hypothetical protein